MKDKRYLLKIASISSIGYILGNIFYYVKLRKLNDEVYANLFLLIIALVFSAYLLVLSNKSIDEIKKKRTTLIISSIYLFFQLIIPGIICFMFIKSLNPKKRKELPIIEEKKNTFKDILASIIVIFVFIMLMFILPKISFFNKISSVYIYVTIFLTTIILNTKYYINDGKIFIKNIKSYLPFIFKRYGIMFITYISVALFVSIFTKGEVSLNQQGLNNMFLKMPFLTFILSCIYAPIVEESVFRLDLHKLIKNKWLFIITSGLLFGILHVVNSYIKPSDLLYSLIYATMGINLAFAYYDSKNIFVSTMVHFIQNTVSTILMMFLLLLW